MDVALQGLKMKRFTKMYILPLLLSVSWVGEAHIILRGHRSVVNQVRCNPSNNVIVSSGVEKVIKVCLRSTTTRFLSEF